MNKKQIYPGIFCIIFLIGVILFFNRYIFQILPNNNWRIWLDHLIAGFISPLLFYILFLGVASFFNPTRKVSYNMKCFFVSMGIYIIFLLIGWEMIIQKFKDIDQIVIEFVGIFLSLIYFFKFRKFMLEHPN